jgi:hypothetical protein
MSILDSPPYLRDLDAATAGLAPGVKVPQASWPGLATALCRHVSDELKASASRKKGPDSALHRAFRLMVVRAEEGERRCGHARLLARRAGALFAHVTEVLEAAGLTSAMGLDYSAVLRNHLLTVPEYCAAATTPTFQGKLAGS